MQQLHIRVSSGSAEALRDFSFLPVLGFVWEGDGRGVGELCAFGKAFLKVHPTGDQVAKVRCAVWASWGCPLKVGVPVESAATLTSSEC